VTAELRPLVGLLTTTEPIDGVAYHAVRDAYVRALTAVSDVDVVLLPAGPAPRLDRLDGVVLGGHQSNVEPRRYGAADRPGELLDPPRDRTAVAAVHGAIGAGVPLLGVCRGMQEMNVALGGTLRALGTAAHREDESLPRDEQYLPAHPIEIRSGGVLHAVVGATTAAVNSLHGQAIDAPAPRIEVEARAPDGVIEAISVTGATAFALGVQWHPEWHAGTDPLSGAVFAAFGAACRRHVEYRRRDDVVRAAHGA
jgi:putative glutamine amidotransferase